MNIDTACEYDHANEQFDVRKFASARVGLPAMLVMAATCLINAAGARAADGPDPIFEKPKPMTMAELAKRNTSGVSAVEVVDFAPGHYTGKLTPSPPHADMNPKKAIVVFWKDHPQRFIFSHEASYCPLLELPNGAAMCNQFFEGNIEGEPDNNKGSAELFNNVGRREKNSYVDVVESGPDRVWVRWNYFAVNKDDDTQPRLRGTEDYFAYPNGLVLRRMTYESLRPNNYAGYSQQPVELFGVAPVGKLIKDLFPRDEKHGDCLTLAALDVYSDKQYEIFWGDNDSVRRSGDDATMTAISKSPGRALVMPFRDRMLFAIIGDASGFLAERSDLVDHCTPGVKAGCQWKQGLWDHWPIGWLNSQSNVWKPGSPYPYSFGSIGQFFIPEGKRYTAFVKDYFGDAKDMELNHWVANRVFYLLLGDAHDFDEVRRIGRTWLDKGQDCAKPASIADLQTSKWTK